MSFWTQEVMRSWDLMEKQWADTVRIDYKTAEELALSHALDDFKIPNWRFTGVYPERELAYAAFMVIVNACNADYNDFENPDKKFIVLNPVAGEKPFTGALAMCRSFYELSGERVLRASDLRPYIGSDWSLKNFFGGSRMPNCEAKRRALFDLAVGLERHYHGNPLNLLEDACVWDDASKRSVILAFHNGKGLCELLVEKFPVAYGEDVQEYGGVRFPFYKRAQLVAVLLHGRALDSRGILPPVADINEVGAIADYEVPKAMRGKGVLVYGSALVDFVDNWREIPKDSAIEIAIRGGMSKASIFMREKMNEKRRAHFGEHFPRLNVCHDDFWWWSMGRGSRLRPHLTRTNAY